MPDKVDCTLLVDRIKTCKTFYFSIHINHPDELTREVTDLIERIRALGYIMLCQNGFFKRS